MTYQEPTSRPGPSRESDGVRTGVVVAIGLGGLLVGAIIGGALAALVTAGIIVGSDRDGGDRIAELREDLADARSRLRDREAELDEELGRLRDELADRDAELDRLRDRVGGDSDATPRVSSGLPTAEPRSGDADGASDGDGDADSRSATEDPLAPEDSLEDLPDTGPPFGQLDAPFMGIERVPDEDRDADAPTGVEIASVVDGSGADEAGLRVGDVIVEVDGEPIETWDDLVEAVAVREVGDRMSVTVLRGSREVTVDVTLGPRPMGLPVRR